MSQSLGTAGDAQLASGAYGAAFLLDLDLADAPVHLITLPFNKDIAGITYLAAPHLQVDSIGTSEDSRFDKIKLSLPLTDQVTLARLTGSASNYRGREVSIWFQVFTTGHVPVGNRSLEWRGYMDPVKVQRKAGSQGITGRIELPCVRVGVARSRRAEGRRVTDAQQQARYPGDLGCQYIQTLTETPPAWLTKAFQEV